MSQYRNVDLVIFGSNVVLSTTTEGRDLFHCNYGYGGLYDGFYYPATFYNNKLGPAYTETGRGDIEGYRDRSYSEKLDAISYIYQPL